jgi:uncharacterized coiled-coil protein SlyX
MTDPDVNERLETLEMSVAHLERTVDQLNQVIIEQGNALRHFQTHQKQLASTLEALELERIRSTNPKPPHYGR